MTSLSRTMRRRLCQDDGFAVTIVVMLLSIALLLVSAAALQGLATTDTAIRDLKERQAIAAANAGLDTAVHRLNMLATDVRVGLGVPVLQQCVVNVSNLLNVSNVVGSSCPPVGGDLGNGETYSYTVKALPTLPSPCLLACTQTINLDRRIVATGMVNCPGVRCVQRRVAADVHAQLTRGYVLNILVTLLNSASVTLYTRGGTVECTASAPVAGDPFSGC